MKESHIENIPVELVDENGWNGNREADEGLVASIRQVGILQPVGVKKEGGRYLLAWGARRLDAARKIGLSVIPAYVRDERTTNENMMSLTLIENLQRLDQKPVQEGRVFKELLENGFSLSDIARRVGKSPSFVRRRLALTGLSPQAQELVEENGAYSVDAVSMLAALTPERQMEIIEKNPHLAASPADMAYAIRKVGRLDGAEFDPTDEALLPEAGPCDKCPKRTGADKLLFDEEDWSGDTCLDEHCFARKLNAHVGREIARLRKKNPDAPCVVEKHVYDYAGQMDRDIFDAHEANPLNGWRIAYSTDEKKRADAKTGILLARNGDVQKVVLVPNAQKKDGRANKPKTEEEKAEFLEKRRMAWVSGQARATVMVPRERPLCDEKTAGKWMKRLAEALDGHDMTADEAARFLYKRLQNDLASGLYVDTVGRLDVAERRERILRALRVLDGDKDAEKHLADLEKMTVDHVP